MFESDDQVVHYARYAGSWLLLGYQQLIEVILTLTIVPLKYTLVYGIHINIEWDGLRFIGSPLATLSSVIIILFMVFLLYKISFTQKRMPGKSSLQGTLFNVDRVEIYSKIMIPNVISDAAEN